MKPRGALTDSLIARRDRIYLTGFMGCGKSTIGPILANSIGYDFLDLDRLIESAAGMSVNAIFKEKGEKHFRQLERDLLARASVAHRTVIALGGGTLVDPANFHLIMGSGIVVYLKMTQEEVFRRLRHKSDRPMLIGDGGARLEEPELRLRIQALYESREPLYARADIIVLTDGKRVGMTVDQIVRTLSTYLE